MIKTSYGGNKNIEDKVKKTEKANCSPSYLFVAIKKINRGDMLSGGCEIRCNGLIGTP